MSRIGHNFPPADELPIPEDVRPGDGWTPFMLEMADHIGPYRTLRLVDAFAGMRLYIPADFTRGRAYEGRGSIRDVVGDEAAAILSHVYRREYLSIPTAKSALARARRHGLIASVRSGDITVTDAAKRIGTNRSYMSFLVNQTDEGAEDGDLPPRNGRRSAGQWDLFGDENDA